MKKLKLFLLAVLTTLSLTSCNMNLIGAYSFNQIHVQLNANEPAYHFEISSWTDSNDNGIEVKIKDGCSMFINGGYVLYKADKCPLCGE